MIYFVATICFEKHASVGYVDSPIGRAMFIFHSTHCILTGSVDSGICTMMINMITISKQTRTSQCSKPKQYITNTS